MVHEFQLETLQLRMPSFESGHIQPLIYSTGVPAGAILLVVRLLQGRKLPQLPRRYIPLELLHDPIIPAQSTCTGSDPSTLWILNTSWGLETSEGRAVVGC